MPEYHDALDIDAIEPGGTTTAVVDGFPVAVANVEGRFFAFQNLCPHLGATLGGQDVDAGGIITCPRHSSRFDVRTGECVRPARDGSDRGLLTFAARVVGDIVQIAL